MSQSPLRIGGADGSAMARACPSRSVWSTRERAAHIVRAPPCNLDSAASVRIAGAVADGRPVPLRVLKPVGEHGSSSVVPSNPNSRVGRKRSPIAQGGVKMDAIVVGIDVSKDRLDVHVYPA